MVSRSDKFLRTLVEKSLGKDNTPSPDPMQDYFSTRIDKLKNTVGSKKDQKLREDDPTADPENPAAIPAAPAPVAAPVPAAVVPTAAPAPSPAAPAPAPAYDPNAPPPPVDPNAPPADDMSTLDDLFTDEEGMEGEDTGEVKPRGLPIRDIKTTVELNVDDVKWNINAIRSGKSLDDEKISTKLAEYYGSLDKPERVALHKLLRGLAQVIVGGISGTSAVEPSDPPKALDIELIDDELIAPGEDEDVEVDEEDSEEEERPRKRVAKETESPIKVVPGANESVRRLRKLIRSNLNRS